jgi:cytoskeletal protein CcmA (bactofilin family)
MWWSKHTQAATSSFSSVFGSTGTIEPPAEDGLSQPRRTSFPATLNFWPDPKSLRNAAANGGLRLDAVVKESICVNCSRLTIGPEARASGEVTTREVVIYGQLAGNLRAAERFEIKKDGSFAGNVVAREVVIERGASFKGTVQIERRRKPRGAREFAGAATV